MRPVLVIGEILADPEGPKGMGVEIACGLAEAGISRVMLASRIGDGEIERGLVASIQDRGVDCSIIQYDCDRPTLRNRTLHPDTARSSAHDMLQWDSDLEQIALDAALVVCTVGMRHGGQARSTTDRALLTAEGVPRVLVLMQDTPALGPIEHLDIGRASDLCEAIVAGEEAFDALRVRTPSDDITRLMDAEAVQAVALAQQDRITVHAGGHVTARAIHHGPIPSAIAILHALALGQSITEAMLANG